MLRSKSWGREAVDGSRQATSDGRGFSNRCGRPGSTATALLGVVALTMASGSEAVAQGLSDDPFTRQVVGEWQGRGEYDGNTLTLSRSWTLELQGRFLRADMRVGMPNGSSFGALLYWRLLDADLYDVRWMDGTGRSQALRVTRDPETGIVSTTFLDELAEDGPEWRTWEFESRGRDSYVERLYRELPDGRQLLTVFTFDRTGGP